MDFNFNRVVERSCGGIGFEILDTLQINVGNHCNLRCRHCQVGASPEGKKVMTRQTIEKIVRFLDAHDDITADVTGGAPEMNPDFKYLMERLCVSGRRVLVRTNLAVFFELMLEWVPRWYSDHNVIIIASLPCYTKGNVDSQRGQGVFDKSIRSLQLLNRLGYGNDGGRELNLVYNPGGAFLPGDQQTLETEYKQHLLNEYSINFNNLFTITNCPIGRFRHQLETEGTLDEYLNLLASNFNDTAGQNVMCKQLLSVDYQGNVYNCDFNQALGLPILDASGNTLTVDQIDETIASGIAIVTGDHCFACTAGAGSSCLHTTQ